MLYRLKSLTTIAQLYLKYVFRTVLETHPIPSGLSDPKKRSGTSFQIWDPLRPVILALMAQPAPISINLICHSFIKTWANTIRALGIYGAQSSSPSVLFCYQTKLISQVAVAAQLPEIPELPEKSECRVGVRRIVYQAPPLQQQQQQRQSPQQHLLLDAGFAVDALEWTSSVGTQKQKHKTTATTSVGGVRAGCG